MKLIFYYSFFAAVAILSNFLVQEGVLYFYSGLFSLWISIFLGTLVGLVVKFVLDKKYIFQFMTVSKKQDASLFILYSVMGVVTTGIFWGMELSFFYIFDSHIMKYVGGLLGLIVGYIVKYYLDKKFVFVEKEGEI